MTPSQSRSLACFGYDTEGGTLERRGKTIGGRKIRGRSLTRFDLDVAKFITALRDGKSENEAIELARKTK